MVARTWLRMFFITHRHAKIDNNFPESNNSRSWNKKLAALNTDVYSSSCISCPPAICLQVLLSHKNKTRCPSAHAEEIIFHIQIKRNSPWHQKSSFWALWTTDMILKSPSTRPSCPWTTWLSSMREFLSNIYIFLSLHSQTEKNDSRLLSSILH